MTADDEDDDTIYTVVINDEAQYSIWPSEKPLPSGWHPVGRTGPKAECLRYIDEVWVDMRPLSLRRAMAAASEDDDDRSPGERGGTP